MLCRLLAGAGVAVLQLAPATPAVAEELPIQGAYGTLASCLLWMNGSIRHSAGHDGDFALLTRSYLDGLEWACDFGQVSETGKSAWRVTARCAEEGGPEDDSRVPIIDLLIEESSDHTRATIGGPDFFRAPLALPSCNLPYDQQLRLELDRIADQ